LIVMLLLAAAVLLSPSGAAAHGHPGSLPASANAPKPPTAYEPATTSMCPNTAARSGCVSRAQTDLLQALTPSGTAEIEGTVTSAVTTEPLEGIEVCAFNELTFECGLSNASGEYTIAALAAGEYTVVFSVPFEGKLNYLAQYYNGKPSRVEATPVIVTSGGTTNGINAALHVGGQVTGKVTDAVTKAAISGIRVCASPTSGEFVSHCATTGAGGEYDVVGVPTGEYRVEFSEGGTAYVAQYYNGKTSFSEAQHVSVAAGATTTGIDAAMQPAGEVTGKVTSETTKAALGGIQVCALPSAGQFPVACVTTNGSGEYALSRLAAGEYKVEFAPPFQSALNYLRQYYSGRASAAEANPVTVSAGVTTSAIDAAMQEGGEVSGTVTDATTKAALSGIHVCASQTSGEFFSHCTATNASGEYTVPGLPAAQYRVEFWSPTGQYATQYYNDKTLSNEANPVSVGIGSTTSGINAALVLSGTIHGTVTSATTKAPVAEIEVCVRQSAGGAFAQCATTNASGEYTVTRLPAGEYKVEFAPSFSSGQNYTTQYYNGESALAEANPVAVTAGGTTSAVNAELHEGGQITGTVTDASTTKPIEGIEVCARKPLGEGVGHCASTNASGVYTVTGVVTGEYKVEFANVGHNYLTQYYNDKTSFSEGGLVSVTTGATTPGIDAAMQPGGRITGTVTGLVSKTPIVGMLVCAFSHTGGVGACVSTNASGEYSVAGLPTAEYAVQFSGSGQNYITQYYNSKAAFGEAQLISVTAGGTTPSINAAMEVGGEITGTVLTAKTKEPISGISVDVYTTSGAFVSSASTNANGEYTAVGLPTGEFKVGFSSGAQEYRTQFYDNGESLAEATLVPATAGGHVTPDVNADLTIAPPVLITAPSVSGTDQEGHTLTEVHGSWKNKPTEFTYQWLQCDSLGMGCLPVSGATEQTYVPILADVGHTVRVVETAYNEGGSTPATSASTEPIVVAPPGNTKAPGISGIAQQGKTLTDVAGAWTNEPTKLKYQWLRCNEAGAECGAISGATESTYVPVAGDVNHTLRVEETAENAAGPGSPAESTQTAVVVPPIPVNTAPPTISGIAQQGKTLTEEHGAWEYSPTEFEYQWLQCNSLGKGCLPIAGATKLTYVPAPGDVGMTLRVQESAKNAGGTSEFVTSPATAEVLLAPPVNTSPPTISGTAQQGKTLTEEHGAWENEPTGFKYEWLRCNEAGAQCSPISGVTEQTYVPVAADVGHTVRVAETAKNAGGASEPATSAATSVVVPPVPVNTLKPTISGLPARQAQQLTAENGSWEYSPIEYTYQWLRCDGFGAGCLPIAGATHQSYTPLDVDVGHELRVQITAHNAGGASEPAESEATQATAGAIPVNTKPPTVEGMKQQGHTLTRVQGEWSNEPEGYEYQWLQCHESGLECVKIPGATAPTYVPTGADVGFTIEFAETAHNAAGAATEASAPTATVIGLAPVPIAPPSIEGTAALGQVLTVKEGNWSNEPASLTHQWLRCKPPGSPCEEIKGQTLDTYPVGTGDIHEVLRLRETATTGSGAHASVETAPTAVVAPPEVKAVAGEDVSTVTGTNVHFDASATTPQYYITSYHWEFGDGASGEGETATHAYSQAKTYTVKLTVFHGPEAAGMATLAVHVAEPPKSHAVEVAVVDAEGGAPLPGTDVLYEAADGTRISGATAEDGSVSLAGLPDGEDFIYAYHPGFAAAAAKVLVSHGEGVTRIELHPGAVKASLHSHELTLEEIREHGINTNDPANRIVYEFSVHLAFRPRDYGGGGGGGAGGGGAEVHGYVNSDGEILGGGPACNGDGCSGPNWTVHAYIVEGEPVLEWMVFNGEASFLKQFFGVSMIVQNLSVHGAKFTSGQATLSLPPGLSLAPTAQPQTLTHKMEDIEGEGSGETEWLIRGDKPGEYRPSATYAATLQPFNAPVELRAVLQEPITVYGASAVKLSVDADEEANDTYPYHLHLILHNTSPVPVYNAEINLSPETHVNFLFQPQERLSRVVGDIPPGEKAETEDFILIPNISGELDVERSFIIETAGEREERTNNVTKHPVVEPPSKAPEISAASSQGKIVLRWAQVPGASGYRVFSTPNRLTPFGEPLAVHPFEHGTVSNGTVTEIPPEEGETQLRAAVDAKLGEERWYAVSSIVNGIPTLYHPIIEATYNPGNPEVETGPVEKLEPTSVTLTGKINPEGAKLSQCRFEIGLQASHYEKQLPCSPALNGAVQALTAPVSGLTKETTYHYRLAVNEGTTALSGGDRTFKTPVPGPPTAETGAVKGLNASEVTLTGTLTPNEATLSTCEFEYGIHAFTNRAPCSPMPTGGYSPVNVEAHLTGITAGQTYQYRLVATNPLGPGTGKTKTFQACDEKEAVIGAAQAVGCLITKDKVQYETVGPVRVSGIDYTPEAGGKVTLDKTTKDMALEGSVRISLSGVTLPVPGIVTRKIPLDGTVFDLSLGGQAKFFKFIPVSGDIKATLVNEEGDYGTKLRGEVSLKPFGENATGGLAVTAFNKTGLSAWEAFAKAADADPNHHQFERCSPGTNLAGFECKLTENPKTGHIGTYLVSKEPGLFKLGPLDISDFVVSYDFAHHVFSAEGTFSLGQVFPKTINVFGQQFEPAKALPEVNVSTTIAVNPFKIRKIKIGGQSLHWKLEPVHFEINEASFMLGFEPFAIGGSIKATVLKDLPLLKEGVQADAGFEFINGVHSGFKVAIHGGPFQFWVLPIDGSIELDLRDGKVELIVGGSISKEIGPAHLSVSVTGGAIFVPKLHLQLKAQGEVEAFGLSAQAKGIISDAGFGVCGEAHIGPFSPVVGVKKRWDGPFEFDGCDFSGLETVSGGAAGLHAALHAAGTAAIVVPPSRSREEIVATGASAPPAVVLAGPSGETLHTPSQANKITAEPAGLTLAATEAHKTYFILENPKAGVWHVAPVGNAPPPVSVQQAGPLEPLDVSASVAGGGYHRTLEWHYNIQPGIGVHFVEEGGTAQTIAEDSTGEGQAKFTVSSGPGRTRTIVAQVYDEGLLQETKTVATLSAPTPKPLPLPRTKRVSYSRSGDTLSVRWTAVADAESYEVEVQLANGAQRYLIQGSVTQTTVTVPHGARVRYVSVTTTAGGLTGRPVKSRRRRR
jgi:hypothetical protein